MTILHMASKIHAFFLASCASGFGTALRRAAKILSTLVGAVGGRREIPLSPLRYLAYSLSGDVWRQHRTI